MEIPGEKYFILKVINGSIGSLAKYRRRSFERVAGLEVDDAISTLSRQQGRRNDVKETKSERADERIIEPLGNLMAEALHVQNGVALECSRFGISTENPRLGCACWGLL